MELITRLEVRPRDLVATLNGTRARLVQNQHREFYAAGAEAVSLMRTRHLRGGTTETATAVRSGRRLAAYGHRLVDLPSDSFALDVGAIAPSGGQVPTHVRVHEGFDAAGQQVSVFNIVPRLKPYLHFPWRKGGGLSKGSIGGWVRTKLVRLRPSRKALPTAAEFLTKELPRRGIVAWRKTLGSLFR